MAQKSETLAANLAIVRTRWPEMAEKIEKTPPISVVLAAGYPQDTLVAEGIHLSSCNDRWAEAVLQASLVPPESLEAWVYGIGLGDLPRVLLERSRLERLFVVMLNPGVVGQSFGYFDHVDWLSDPRVIFMTGEGLDEVRFPFAAVPPCLQLADDASSRIRDLVFLELATPYIRRQHGAANEHLLVRLKENEGVMREDGDVASLFGSRNGETVLVAAAGPTLSHHFDWLGRQQTRHGRFLIAVDAAFRALAEAGIVPDMVVTMDANREGVLSFFEGIDLAPFKKTSLLYFPLVHADVLNLWPGPRLVSYVDHPLYVDLSSRLPRANLFSSGSVIHPAVDIAVRMGGARIVLCGADFSFPGGRTYVNGGQVRPRAVAIGEHWVLNGYGERVPTAPNYRGFLRDLERYICAHEKVVFVNASRAGALIKGAAFLENLDGEQ